MFSRTSLLAAVLTASSVLLACSSDEGAPTSSNIDSVVPAGSKEFLEGCVKDADCKSSVCYLGDQGSYCSLKCTGETATTVCVAPFAGTCNKKGFCRKP
jgi:hypothetical protein